MKKLFLAAVLSILCTAVFANNKVRINNTLPCGATVTVQFIQYQPVMCTNNGTSPVYTPGPGQVYDLDDKNTWLPTILQSYQTYSAIICITCPGGSPTICIGPVGIGPNPTCDPSIVGPTLVPCCGNVMIDVTSGGGGGCSYDLNIHP